MNDDYEDIINLPHHVSVTHPHMSSDMRAAQFSPFAALTGYEEGLEEAVRQTSKWIELDDSVKEIINRELNVTRKKLERISSGHADDSDGPAESASEPFVRLEYFVPDMRKDGGEYRRIEGNVRKLDEYNGIIVMEDGENVRIDRIVKFVNAEYQ